MRLLSCLLLAAHAIIPLPLADSKTDLGELALEQPPVIEDTPTLTAEERATLDTLSKAEGTWDEEEQEPDYTIRFGDRPGQGTLDVTKPHPRDVRGSRFGSGYRSNASGAYQFLSSARGHTWEEFNDGTNAVMSPENQDAAALRLIEERTGYDFTQSFCHQAYLLAGTWASIPTRSGYSYYGQPVKSLQSLCSFYAKRLQFWSAEYDAVLSTQPA